MNFLQNIAIIGNGNVGSFFKDAFARKEIASETFARHPSNDENPLSDFTGKAKKFDLVLLCVNDDSIGEISSEFAVFQNIIAHVSGAASLEILNEKHPRRAVFYPLMSFRPKAEIGLEKIPICLEADNPEDLIRLRNFVETLGARWFEVTSEQRQFLHLAAVFAHNFSNHLFHISNEILANQKLDFKMLIPLLENAIQQLQLNSPQNLQTGPARRGDTKTIEKHLSLLTIKSDKEIYKMLTENIAQLYDQKL